MKIICYGLSGLCKEFLSRNKYHVEYVVDKNVTTHGEYCVGDGEKVIPVFPPEKLKEEEGDYIVLIMTLNPQNHKEIKENLKLLDVSENKCVYIENSEYDRDYLYWDYYLHDSVFMSGGGEKYFPKILHLELTDTCNLRCKFCWMHGMRPMREDFNHFMTMDTAKEIAKQAAQIHTLETLYITHDGEDFIHKQWFEICSYILEHTGVRKFKVYTNGMLLNDENIKKLEMLPCDQMEIVVSIDGKTPEENDSIRIGSKYEVIKSNLRNAMNKLSDRKYNFFINNNYIIDEEEVKKINYCFALREAFQNKVPEYLKKDFPSIRILSKPTLFTVPIDMSVPEGYKGIKVRKSDRIAGCFDLYNILSVTTDGSVLFCGCCVTQEKLGNIFDNQNTTCNLLDLWQNHPTMVDARKKLRYDRVSPDLCKHCSCKINGDFYIICREE